ncbi:transcriptional regulator [Paenibacillus swuensis]|uniref:Transcriptional regulator n=1 Tax=Paenibacillus swuensis TaxID=1178515 RepID=A0A172TGE1_9BACL|nr:TetR/AcrR family transcriptional regulator [Paenibacillus swuensis]ANE46080.1 transcriptional regulator [Paenibacillus swuensis]
MDTSVAATTHDKLLLAAIDLMSEKGYNGVTTKEIAAMAGVSEMTLFRKFGNKQKLLEEALERFYYAGAMRRIFSEEMVWDLKTDLLLVSRTYQEIMKRNRKLIQIMNKESHQLPELRKQSSKHPQQLLELLKDYLVKMQAKGLVGNTPVEGQALAFMYMNYGAAMTNLHSPSSVMNMTMDTFIEISVEMYTRALQP